MTLADLLHAIKVAAEVLAWAALACSVAVIALGCLVAIRRDRRERALQARIDAHPTAISYDWRDVSESFYAPPPRIGRHVSRRA